MASESLDGDTARRLLHLEGLMEHLTHGISSAQTCGSTAAKSTRTVGVITSKPLRTSRGVQTHVMKVGSSHPDLHCIRGCGVLLPTEITDRGFCDFCHEAVRVGDRASVCPACDSWMCSVCAQDFIDGPDDLSDSSSSSSGASDVCKQPTSQASEAFCVDCAQWVGTGWVCRHHARVDSPR